MEKRQFVNNSTQQTKTMTGKIHIRPVQENELKVLTDWANKENWLASNHAIRAGYSYDPQGFLVAVNGDNEQLGFIAVVNHSDDMSFIGLFIVREDARGTGIGGQLFEAGERHLGGRNVALNAMLDKIDVYERRRVANKLFEIDTFIGTPKPIDMNIKNDKIIVTLLSNDLLTPLVEYDAVVHTIKRENFLSKWLTADVACTLVAIADEHIVGYGCLYEKHEKSYAIAPLFADNFQTASLLLNNLLLKLEPGSTVTFYVPKTQKLFEELLKSRGFQLQSRCLRMSRREHPNILLSKVFFLTDASVSLI